VRVTPVTPDGDVLLERIRVALISAGVAVVDGEACGDRVFLFDVGGDLDERQEADISALCNLENLKIDLQSPNHRRVIDGRA